LIEKGRGFPQADGVKPGKLILLLLTVALLAGCAGLSDQTVTVGPPPPHAPKEPVVPTRARPDVAIPLGSGLARLAVGEGAVWVLQGGRLLKLDPKSNRVLAAQPRIRGLSSFAAGEGGVWVPDGSKLLKIDPQTGKLIARIPVKCRNIAVGAGSVWATNPKKGTVLRIDPRTGRVVATIDVDKSPLVLAVGEGAVWALSWEKNIVFQIDPETNQVVAKVPLGTGIPIGQLAAGEGGVWLSKQARLPLGVANALIVIDPGSKRVTRVFKTWFDGRFALGGGAVWVATPEYVARINVTSGQMVEKVLLHTSEYGEMVSGEGALWLVGDRGDTLWRINFQPPGP
jgi:DNA-binding beta-propeller fold protein YncE